MCTRQTLGCGETTPARPGEKSAWRFLRYGPVPPGRCPAPGIGPGTEPQGSRPHRRPPMKPMKKRMLQDHTIQDALAFWQLLRQGKVPSALGRAHGEHHHPAVSLRDYRRLLFFWWIFSSCFCWSWQGCIIFRRPPSSFLVGISCNFLLTKFFAFKSVDPTVGPTAEVFVFAAISGGGLVLTMVLMYLFTSRLQLYFMVSKLISSILVFFLEFPGSEVHSLPRKGPRTCLTPPTKKGSPWRSLSLLPQTLRPTPASPVQDCLPGGSMAQPEGLPGASPQVELHRVLDRAPSS